MPAPEAIAANAVKTIKDARKNNLANFSATNAVAAVYSRIPVITLFLRGS